MKKTSFFIAVLLVLSMISAGISPACAFISGQKHFIEICAPDGSLKKIEVDPAQFPMAKAAKDLDSGKKKSEKKHLKSTDCAFCFSLINDKAENTGAQHNHLWHYSGNTLIKYTGTAAISTCTGQNHARGPPA